MTERTSVSRLPPTYLVRPAEEVSIAPQPIQATRGTGRAGRCGQGLRSRLPLLLEYAGRVSNLVLTNYHNGATCLMVDSVGQFPQGRKERDDDPFGSALPVAANHYEVYSKLIGEPDYLAMGPGTLPVMSTGDRDPLTGEALDHLIERQKPVEFPLLDEGVGPVSGPRPGVGSWYRSLYTTCNVNPGTSAACDRDRSLRGSLRTSRTIGYQYHVPWKQLEIPTLESTASMCKTHLYTRYLTTEEPQLAG